MTLDLNQFLGPFFEESFEALDSMEDTLLRLDVGAPDMDAINSVFRVAHSIKGGSGMFGLTSVAAFTHVLETLLDDMRAGRKRVTAEISDLLLRSVDTLRAMLAAIQRGSSIDDASVAALKAELEACVSDHRDEQRASHEALPDASSPHSNTQTGVRIRFVPRDAVLAGGLDPIQVLAQLETLGLTEVEVETARLPPLKDLEVGRCYLSWNVLLRGGVDLSAVHDALSLVLEGCELDITPLPDTVMPLPGDDAKDDGRSSPSAPRATTTGRDSGPDLGGRPAATAETSSIRVSIEKIDELINNVGEIVITQSMLTQFARKAEGHFGDAILAGLAQLERNIRELQECVMRVRMLPIGVVFSRFPRLVRDLSQRLGKQIELRISGEQTELDKTVLERIGDPLVHLIRNSVDHGIEHPEVRVANGKPATGTVRIDAYHKSGSIVIEVSDDGAGLNRQRLIEKGRAIGVIGPTEEPSDEAVWDLIFLPGLSTAETATDISGRGVGMDVVRRNIKDLGGSIEIGSSPGSGTRFRISLPLTLAIVDGQSVAVGTETYIVPLVSIIESLQITPDQVRRLVGHGEVFCFRGEYVPLVRLNELFGLPSKTDRLAHDLVMVVEGDGRKIGLLVDALLGQQQVVIKSLEANFRRVDGISGATILGDGSVALILDVTGLVRLSGERLAA